MACFVAETLAMDAPPTSGMSSGGWGQMQPCMVGTSCVRRQIVPRSVVEVAAVMRASTIAPGSAAPSTLTVTF